MKLYIHKKTVRYYDYRELLDTELGVAFSNTGKAEDSYGFQREEWPGFLETARREAAGSTVEVLEGEPVERKCNMNTHGLV